MAAARSGTHGGNGTEPRPLPHPTQDADPETGHQRSFSTRKVFPSRRFTATVDKLSTPLIGSLS
jgi:hypothetical protein